MYVKQSTKTTERRPLSRRKILVFYLMSLCLASGVVFLIAETLTRVLLARRPNDIEAFRAFERRKKSGEPLLLSDIIKPSDNPKLIYELIPNVEGVLGRQNVRINSGGFRDKERTVNKPDGTFRIAAIGDSITFGWGARMEDRFTDKLESFLNNTVTTASTNGVVAYEVLNWGVPGYNTVMEEELLRTHVSKYAPDCIILVFCHGNDSLLPNFITKPPPLYTLRRSYLLDRLFTPRSEEGANPLAYGLQFHAPTDPPEEYKWMVGWDAVREALVRMNEQADANGWSKLLFMECCEIPRRQSSNQPAPKADCGSDIIEFAGAMSFHHAFSGYDVAAFLDDRNLKNQALWVAPDDRFPDGHPNAIAHAIHAKVLYRVLAENKLLPDAQLHIQDLDRRLSSWDAVIEKQFLNAKVADKYRY